MIKQQTFNDDLERFKKWKLGQVRYDTEFGITFAPAKDGSIDLKKIEEEEFISRKIITKVMKERRSRKEPFNAGDAQMSFLDGLAKDDEVSDYQRRIVSGQIFSDGLISPRGGIDTSRTSKSKGGANTDRFSNSKRVDQENME